LGFSLCGSASLREVWHFFLCSLVCRIARWLASKIRSGAKFSADSFPRDFALGAADLGICWEKSSAVLQKPPVDLAK
jgi:hypothetical protein